MKLVICFIIPKKQQGSKYAIVVNVFSARNKPMHPCCGSSWLWNYLDGSALAIFMNLKPVNGVKPKKDFRLCGERQTCGLEIKKYKSGEVPKAWRSCNEEICATIDYPRDCYGIVMGFFVLGSEQTQVRFNCRQILWAGYNSPSKSLLGNT